MEEIGSVAPRQDLLVIDESHFRRLRDIGRLDFQHFLATLQKLAHRLFDEKEKETFWQIDEAALQWTQSQENREVSCLESGTPKFKTVFCPKITLKIINREGLVSIFSF